MTSATRTGRRVRVPLRWRDLDHQGHLYHATMLTLLDEARTAWLSEVIGVPHADSYVIAKVEIDYLHEVRMGDERIDVTFDVSRVGTRSLTTEETVRLPNGTQAARASVVSVMWDRQVHSTRELTASERARAHEELPDAKGKTDA